MKKSLVLTALACVAVLTACQKNDSAKVSTCHFEKGQKVTLTIGMGGTDTKAKGNGLDFVWEDNDAINVSVNGVSREFSMVENSGSTASFSGEMPESGQYFSVEYGNSSTSNLLSQSYNENGTPSGKMYALCENCTLESSINLEPQFSALRLKLYGSEVVVTSIEVTLTDYDDGTGNKTFTLGEIGKEISSDESDPTKFYLVLPVIGEEVGGSRLSVVVNYNGNMSASFSTGSSKIFEQGKLTTMAAKEIKEPEYEFQIPVETGEITSPEEMF